MAIKKISNDAYKLVEDQCKSKILKIFPESKGIEIGPPPDQRESMENLKNDEKLWELTKTEPVLIYHPLVPINPITSFTWNITNRNHLLLYQNYFVPSFNHYY